MAVAALVVGLGGILLYAGFGADDPPPAAQPSAEREAMPEPVSPARAPERAATAERTEPESARAQAPPKARRRGGLRPDEFVRPSGWRPNGDSTLRRMRAPAWSDVALDEDALASSGLSPERIDRIRDVWEQLLHDDARREAEAGWENGTGRTPGEALDDQAEALRDARDELGDDDFDKMLEETGQHNRLVLTEVLSRGAASQAGLQRGDVLLEVNGQEVFEWRDLVRNMGEIGDAVPVVFRRGDTEIETTLPSSPSGDIGGYLAPQNVPSRR